MNEVGKILVVIGLAIAVLGAGLWLSSQLGIPLGRMPGDIRIERDNFKFYFPLTTCLVISAVLTVLIWWLRRR